MDLFYTVFIVGTIGCQRMVSLLTNALVATGAAIFIVSSLGTTADNPSRIATQVVSGVGFLDAGIIMRQGMNVSSLNSVATLWCSAAVGLLRARVIRQCLYRDFGLFCANILLR